MEPGGVVRAKSNPYAPPGAAEESTRSVERSKSRPVHWLWKAYAAVFCPYVAYESFVVESWWLELGLLWRQLVLIWAGAGMLGFVASRRLGPRWLWTQLWWVFPLSEVACYALGWSRFSILLDGDRYTVQVFSGFPTEIAFLPVTSLGLYRYGRARYYRSS